MTTAEMNQRKVEAVCNDLTRLIYSVKDAVDSLERSGESNRTYVCAQLEDVYSSLLTAQLPARRAVAQVFGKELAAVPEVK